MAENLHKLAIEIQGEVDAKFGDSIKEMEGHLKQLEDGVKNIALSETKPDAISKEFIRMNHAAGETAQELNKLNLQMRQADGFVKLGKEVEEAEEKLSEARDEVERLEELQKASGTKKFAEQIKAARKEAAAAERAYNKQKSALTTLDGKLRDAGIDTDKLSDEQKRLAGDLEQVTAKSKNLGDQMERLSRAKYHFSELRGHVKQLGADFMWLGKAYLKIGGALGAGGFGLYKIVDSAAAAGDAAAESAEKLHMNAEAFQELQYAANMSGVKNFDAQMLKFNASLAKMAANTKSGPGKELKDLGINAKQFAKMKPEEALLNIADEMNRIKDPAQRARAEMALFGKGGAEMGVLMRIGSSGMKELIEEARALGLVISDEAAQQAGAFNDARDKMQGALSGLKNIIGIELIPVFTDMFDELSGFFVENQDVIKDFAVNLGGEFREMLPTLKELARGAGNFAVVMWDVGKVVTRLVGGVENLGVILAALPLIKPAITIGKLGGALYGLTTNLMGVRGAAGSLGRVKDGLKGVGGAAGSLGGLKTSLKGVSSAIFGIGKALFTNPIGIGIAAIATSAFLIYKYWEPITGFFSDKWNDIKEGAASAKESIAAGWSSLPDRIEDAVSGVPDALAALWEGAKEKSFAAKDFIIAEWSGLPGPVQDALSGVSDVIAAPFQAGRAAVQGIIGYFKGDFVDLPSALTDIFADVKDTITQPFGDAFGWVETKWASLKNWLGIGPTINADVNVAEVNSAGGRARGGRQDTPALIPFAERGAEVAVPLGLADRSHGIASLNMASRGLGFGNVVNPTGMEDRLKGAPAVQTRNIRIDANFPMPQVNVTVHGGDPEEERRKILDILREFGAKMIPEWKEQIERAAYGTA